MRQTDSGEYLQAPVVYAGPNNLPDDPNELSATGMFAAPIAIDDDADTQSKFLARFGRNPSWRVGSEVSNRAGNGAVRDEG